MKKIFFNGKFVDEKKAVVPVTTHALHYGTGCFEGIRAYYSEKDNELVIFRMRDHYKRLLNSCKIMFIDLPYSVDQLCKITVDLLKYNFSKSDLYIRPLAFKSDPAIGNFDLKKVKDSLIIYAIPLGRHYGKKEGLRINVSSWTRVADNSIPPRAKISGAYANTCLVKTESSLLGFDEAVMLDRDGHITEGSAENIFIVKDGVVITPPVYSDILEGITRDTIIKICKEELKLQVEERVIDRTELYGADEVFLSGTGAEINPVIEVDSRTIADGKIGKIGQLIMEIYKKMVHGEYSGYENFVTKVSAG